MRQGKDQDTLIVLDVCKIEREVSQQHATIAAARRSQIGELLDRAHGRSDSIQQSGAQSR
jgi:hypothetical protein